MLIEALKYLKNSMTCPKSLKELGVLTEIISIESRAARCKRAWSNHLENSKEAIIAAVKSLDKASPRIMILGAALLNDVPIAELAARSREIVLVDLYFPQKTRKLLADFANVKTVELDVTGSLDKVKQLIDQRFEQGEFNFYEQFAELKELDLDFIDGDFDLVVSCNLLSQLPVFIKEYYGRLLEKQKNPSDFEGFTREIDFYLRSLVENHLKLLQSLTAQSQVLLLSDIQRSIYDPNGDLIEVLSSIEDVELDWQHHDSWTWELAPYGELHKDYKLVLDVRAYWLKSQV